MYSTSGVMQSRGSVGGSWDFDSHATNKSGWFWHRGFIRFSPILHGVIKKLGYLKNNRTFSRTLSKWNFGHDIAAVDFASAVNSVRPTTVTSLSYCERPPLCTTLHYTRDEELCMGPSEVAELSLVNPIYVLTIRGRSNWLLHRPALYFRVVA